MASVHSQFWPILVWPGFGVTLGACAMTIALIVLLRPLLVRYALARPNARSSHREPTPQGGGVAIIIAVIAATFLAVQATAFASGARELLPLLAATVLLAACGAVDDIRAVGVLPRLLLHALAALVVVGAVPAELRIFDWMPTWVERALIVLAGVWFINLVNFMDGIDWMSVAEFVPVTLGLALIGALDALPPAGIAVALALLGGLLGFAPFNRPVARLFLGDVGSLPIGLLTGWMLVHVAMAGHIAAALLLPLYYLADATVTLLRRIGNGEEVWQAHRSHFYQRATANGYSVMQVVTLVFLVNVALVALAIATVIVPSTIFDTLAVFTGCALVSILLIGFVKNEPSPVPVAPPQNPPQPQSKET